MTVNFIPQVSFPFYSTYIQGDDTSSPLNTKQAPTKESATVSTDNSYHRLFTKYLYLIIALFLIFLTNSCLIQKKKQSKVVHSSNRQKVSKFSFDNIFEILLHIYIMIL